MTAKRILLVEDDKTDAHLIERAFRTLPFEYHLDKAQDGLAALEKLEKGVLTDNLPDLVLLDLLMPRMSGFELLKKIRAHPKLKNLKTVVLTGADSDESLLEAYEAGATSYAAKPGNRLEFRRFVAEVAQWWVVEAV